MQQSKTNGAHNWFYSNSQNVSVFKHTVSATLQHLLPCSVVKCSHDVKFLVPLLTSFLQSQNNLATGKVLNKTGLMLGSVSRSLRQLPGWRNNCSPPAHLNVCVLNVHLPEQSLRALRQCTTGSTGVCQGECHSAENSDAKAGSWDVTVAPLTPPT